MSVPANSFISAPSVGSCCACALHPSWAQQRLDRAALIHCAVGFRHLIERQGHVEDLAGVDLPVPHQLDQLRQVASHESRTTVKMDVGEEQLLAVKLDPAWDADVAH